MKQYMQQVFIKSQVKNFFLSQKFRLFKNVLILVKIKTQISFFLLNFLLLLKINNRLENL